MPTKVKVVKSNDKKVRISLAFTFDDDDERAEAFYRAIGLCLKEALTPEEAQDFIFKFQAAVAES